MNKTAAETKAFFNEFNPLIGNTKNTVVVFPSFLSVSQARKTASKKIFIGSQNLFSEEKGEFTGEVSVLQAKEFCSFVILGHSDRRRKFNESSKEINAKIKKALEFDFNVILCIGETLQERQESKTFRVIKKQFAECLEGIAFSPKLILAYEPVWAIGTGKTAAAKDISEVHSFIRKQLTAFFGSDGSKTGILYGGSVKPSNTREIFSVPDVNGVLVGGASLNPKTFAEIIHSIK